MKRASGTKRTRLTAERFATPVAAVFTIVTGLLVSFVILLIFEREVAFDAFGVMISGSFGVIGVQKGMARVLYYATPLMLTGLSVGFTMRTGVFNIGVAGQFVVGLFTGVYVSIRCAAVFGEFTWLAAILAGAAAGGVWGGVQGALQAFFNIHPIVCGIMLNYIGLFTVSALCESDPLVYAKGRGWTEVVPPQAVMPDGGFGGVFGETAAVGAGLYIAIALCVAAHFVLKKTAFGYEIKAVGHNADASEYAGISVRRAVIASMMIAGLIAGLGGAVSHLSAADTHYAITDTLPQQGFTGISVALIAASNPIGIIFAAVFVAFLQVGGLGMQAYRVQPDFVNVITSLIIWFCAFSFVFRRLCERLIAKMRKPR